MMAEQGYGDFTISGRDALATYGYCSADPSIMFLELDSEPHFCLDTFFVPKSKSNEINIINGIKYAKKEKALLDFIENDYDDSAIEECFQFMSDKDIDDFKKYIKEVGKYEKISSDKRWSDYLL